MSDGRRRRAARELLAMTIVVAAEPLSALHMQIVEVADRIAPRLTPEYLAEAGDEIRETKAALAAPPRHPLDRLATSRKDAA